jgi:hypothetical protein
MMIQAWRGEFEESVGTKRTARLEKSGTASPSQKETAWTS